jgi:hypothetical protein
MEPKIHASLLAGTIKPTEGRWSETVVYPHFGSVRVSPDLTERTTYGSAAR